MAEEKEKKGLPSIDKPWMKYYNKEDTDYVMRNRKHTEWKTKFRKQRILKYDSEEKQ